HDERWHADLLQGLGQRTARRVQSRLAAQRRRLGRSDGFPCIARLPVHCARSSRTRPVESAVERQRHGYVRGRPGRAGPRPRPDASVSQGLRDTFWLQGMQAGLKNVYDCIKVFSETDLTEDLRKFDVPTLIMHGDDDQIVPIADSALLSAKIVKGATLKVYKG